MVKLNNEQLKQMTKGQLTDFCRSHGIKGYSGKTKLQRINLIKKYYKINASKKKISMIQIKRKYPHLYEAVDEMGMDNSMNVDDKATINEYTTTLNNANKLLKFLKGHTIEEVVKIYNISKNIPSMEYGEDNALMEYTMGEDEFIQGVRNKAKYGKQTQKLMNDFFEGKHTHIYA